MSKMIESLRQVLGIGLAWTILWGAFWLIVMTIIGVVNPGTIDPGEGPMVVAVLGPMGFFSGVAFGVFLSLDRRGRSDIEPSLIRVAVWGVLGSGIVQLAYLGHGDQGLAANIQMALLFCVLGGVVTMVWRAVARKWWHWRSA